MAGRVEVSRKIVEFKPPSRPKIKIKDKLYDPRPYKLVFQNDTTLPSILTSDQIINSVLIFDTTIDFLTKHDKSTRISTNHGRCLPILK